MLTKAYVNEVFSALERGDLDGYLERFIDPNVQWTITGTNELAGLYKSRQQFIDQAITRLKANLDGGIRLNIQHVFVDNDTAVVEMVGEATSKKGLPYNNQYVWIQKFKDGKVVECRVYYDDVLLNQLLEA